VIRAGSLSRPDAGPASQLQQRPGRRRSGPRATAWRVSVYSRRCSEVLGAGQGQRQPRPLHRSRPEPRTSPHKNNTRDDTASRRTKALITTRIQSNSRSNIALQLTGTALHLSLVKSLARLHQRSKAAPAAERNVRPSTGLHAAAELHAEVQISRSSQASCLGASTSPPAPEVSLATRLGGTRHQLRRASASGLRGKPNRRGSQRPEQPRQPHSLPVWSSTSTRSRTQSSPASSQFSLSDVAPTRSMTSTGATSSPIQGVGFDTESLHDIDCSWVLTRAW